MKGQTVFRIMLGIGVLAIIGLLVVVASTKKEEVGPASSWQTYTSKDPTFSVMYPEGWTIDTRNRHDVECTIRFVGDTDTSLSVVTSMTNSILMSLLKNDVPGQKPLKVFHEALVDGMKAVGRSTSFEASETTEMKIAGAEAYGTTFEFRSWNPFMGRSMEGMLVTTMVGENYIGLSYLCPTSKHESMFANFGAFMASFKPQATVSAE